MKKIILVLLILLTPLCLFGCQPKSADYSEVSQDRFIIIKRYKDSDLDYSIVVDKDTQIMYLKIEGTNRAGITVLLDENGNPQKYEGEL